MAARLPGLRRFVSGAVLAAAAALTLAACEDPAHQPVVAVKNRLPDLNFELSRAGGETVTQDLVRGTIPLVFFGYANCPDVCPTTMARLAQVLQALGDDARDVRILFISVDPHRDTPELLERYVKAFDQESALGLTGTPRQIADLARRYRVSFEILKPADPSNPNYDVNHSKGVFVFDRSGAVRYLVTNIDAPGSTEALTGTLRTLVAES
ncbi:SCO family protein [Achromobacter sp. GG226]|uniref:SCO family protein n=1 Tax=Verticiella alkaliphila TaxID=2779529 RepID=UPI001C0D87DA|nr:SCO family protein [Verticiella sp. GG226]MBU4612678.1 SCO family protein [Verticiella sp. GG226]